MPPRPRYESTADRDREASFARRYAAETGLVLHKLSEGYRADFAVTRGNETTMQVVAWIEYKHRAMTWGTYPDIVLSFAKAASLVQLAQRSGVRALFVVEDVSGEFRQADLSTLDGLVVSMGGRTTNTRDRHDVEPVVAIPLSRFERVKPAGEIPF